MDLRGVLGGVGVGRRVDESDVYTTQAWKAKKKNQNLNKCFGKINNLMLKCMWKKSSIAETILKSGYKV